MFKWVKRGGGGEGIENGEGQRGERQGVKMGK